MVNGSIIFQDQVCWLHFLNELLVSGRYPDPSGIHQVEPWVGLSLPKPLKPAFFADPRYRRTKMYNQIALKCIAFSLFYPYNVLA